MIQFTFGKRYNIVLSFIFVVGCLLAPCAAFAKPRKKPTPSNFQKPYKHVCAAGTEEWGEPPPKGSKKWCRQPILKGYSLEGAYTEWYPEGHRKVEGVYHLNKKNGKWVKYYPNGRVQIVTEYENGKETKKTRFDGNGKELDDSKRKERMAKLKEQKQKTKEEASWLRKTRKVRFD